MYHEDQYALPPHEAFDQLARIVLSEHSIESVMTAIAEISKRLLPVADEVSVTFVRRGRAHTVACTGPLALAMDERQYAGQQGPCLTAAATGELVRAEDARNDGRWPTYATAAREHGVLSSLSVPVKLPEPVGAAINLYSRRDAAFGDPLVDLAQTLASYAGVALANMHLYEAQASVAENLRIALESRAVIEQAKGVLMAERRVSADDAFQLLVGLSQDTNRKLRDVAAALVERTAP